MDEFLDDVQNIQKLDKFEGGIPAEREKANKGVAAINTIIEAAERAVANNANGGTIEAYIEDGGTSRQYIITAKLKA